MAYISEFFINRISEHPGRLKLTNIDSQEEMTVDAERLEGTVTVEGTPFNAAAMNRIADELLEIGEDNASLIAQSLTLSATPSAAWRSTGTVKYDKFGELVIVSFDVTAATQLAANSDTIIAVLPSSYAANNGEERAIIRGQEDLLLVVGKNGDLLAVFLRTGSNAVASGTRIVGELAFLIS